MTSPSRTKAERLLQIEMLLLAHPEGLTQAEIARRLGVHRSTVNRYIPDLSGYVYIDDLDGNRWKVDRSTYLVNVRFNLNEALAVHMAARLLATRSDKHNPHAAAALRKLGLALERLAPRVSQHLLQSADVMDDAARVQDPVYLQALEKLTLAWAEGRKVQVWHRNEEIGQVFEYTFAPYFIDPYAVGNTAHVIGYRDPPGALRTFKVERIERVELSRVPYTIPEDFNPQDLLADAWGIWYTQSETVGVVLRFHPHVANRVRETHWHSSEVVEEQPDGFLIWRAQVAEPQEMLPWIRGWGADVEVLGPEGLRNKLENEVQRLARIYNIAPSDKLEQQFFAHSKKDASELEWQLLKDHLYQTSRMASDLGVAAGLSEPARIAGLLHDIGKYSRAFQNRLRGSKQHVDHATAGAREIAKLYSDPRHKVYADLISYCIAGHHTGLPDYGSPVDVAGDGTLLARRDKKSLQDYSAYKTELDTNLLDFQPPNIQVNRQYPGFSISFMTRMIFSILVDADWLETERYFEDVEKPRGQYADVEMLAKEFSRFLEKFCNPQTEINRTRTDTLNACIDQSSSPPGFFTLTVPTGGGKTCASMAFALRHALEHELERIIYVIPFTSIIEQNAGIFREALGPLGQENVLEHHSNFDWEGTQKVSDDETNRVFEKLKLAVENWDIPIVVTTNVQFFESLFANKKRSARKLHNIAKSVIIFDEVQMLPLDYLKPCLLALQELVHNYKASVVLCTATQPSLQQFFPEEVEFKELAPKPKELFDFYKRVEVCDLGKLKDQELIEELEAHRQALCIVNTRKHAKGLFDLLDEDGRYHLSTLMCPKHRRKTLTTIKRLLADKSRPACRVISTQVMEAGVDLDFPVGYRAMAGLDSIIQAAGRVNREGKQSTSEMFVFRPDTKYIKRTPLFIQQTASVAEKTLREHEADPVSMEAIQAYYTTLYSLQDESSFDVKNIIGCLDRGDRRFEFDFATAAERFKLIDRDSVSVIIPYDDDAIRWIESLKHTDYPQTIIRKLQQYTVNVYEKELLALQSLGVIQTLVEQYHVLDDRLMDEYYRSTTGLVLPEDGGGEAVFFE